MAKNRKNKRIGAKRKKTVLSPEIFLKGGRQGEEHIIANVQRETIQLNARKKYELIFELASHPKLPRSMVPIYHSFDTYYSIYDPASFLDSYAYAYWALGIFYQYSEKIEKFIELREIFNSSFLAGNGKKCLEVLDDIDEISLSWWSFEARVHLKKEVFGESAKPAIKNVEQYFEENHTSGFTRRLLMLSESSSIDVFSEILNDEISEYRISGQDYASGFSNALSLLTLPAYLDPKRRSAPSTLYFRSDESIIDQYVLLKALLTDISIAGPMPERFLVLIKKLNDNIDDPELNNIIAGQENESCEFLNQIVEDYTKGNYERCISSIENEVGADLSRAAGLFEIYGRSKIYCDQSFGNTIFDKISKNLASIVNMEQNCSECILYIKKMCVKFRNELWARSLLFHLVSLLEETEGAQSVKVCRLQTKGLGPLNTPKALFSGLSLDVNPENQEKIPRDRAVRMGLLDEDDEYFHPQNFPIKSDFIIAKSKRFLNYKKNIELMDFVVNQYLSNPISFLFLPLREVARLSIATSKDTPEKYILCLLVLYIYSKEIDAQYEEERADIFEDYLDLCNTHLPSKIFENRKLSEKDVYFLKNVCITSQLDNITAFESNDSVVHERINILDVILKSKKRDPEPIKKEKDREIEALFSSKLRAKIESGKLFVDVQALESRKKESYLSLYEHAKSILDGDILESLKEEKELSKSENILEIDGEGEIPVAVSSSKKTDVVMRIFREAVKDFALNEDYGLDKYLSAEIRHFVFVSQLRSCFEKQKIITSYEDGSYLSNGYWREKYSYISEYILDGIDEVLKKFSENVDHHLAKVNRLFKVTDTFRRYDDAQNGDCIFDFSAYYTRLVQISRLVVFSSDFEDFFYHLIQYMWDICASEAKRAQQIIDDQLRGDILKQLDILEEGVNDAKGGTVMHELGQKIKTSKSDFIKEIELVLNWFKPAGSDNSKNYDKLGIVIEATISAFESIYEHRCLNLETSFIGSKLKLSYRESRSLFVALFTVLENASTYRQETSPIVIEQIDDDATTFLKIYNRINIENFDNTDKFVENQKAKWNDDFASLSTEEGGSGLFKTYNHLTKSSSGFSFDIDIKDQLFIAIIGLKNGYFTR